MSSETLSFKQEIPTTPTTNTLPSQPVNKPDIIDGFDFSKAEQANVKDLIIIPEEKEEVPTSTTIEGFDFSQAEKIKVSNLEKLEYAFDKNTQMIGNVFRIGRAKIQDLFDEDKTFKDYIIENEATRQEGIRKEHWKFSTGLYDDDIIVKAGELATLIVDPGYLLAYATPWGRAALTSYKMASLVGGSVVGADTLLRDLATKGEVDVVNTGIATAAGAALGPLGPAATKLFRKYVPKATQSQIDEVINLVEAKVANEAGTTVPALQKFRTIIADKEVIKATEAVNQWSSTNFQASASKATGIFKKFEEQLLDKNKLLLKLHQIVKKTEPIKGKVPGMLPQTKTFRQQYLDNKLAIKEADKALEKTKAEIFKIQQPKIQKYADLIAKRDGLILEKIFATESKSDWAVRSLLNLTTKPLAGGAGGVTAAVLFGDEDTKLMNYFIVGATLGATQKYIQASKKFNLGDKNKILNIIDSEAVKHTLQQLRSWTSSTSSTKLKSYGGATEQVGNLLLEGIDSSISQKSVVANAERLTKQYQRKAYDLLKPYGFEEQLAAISIVRGKQLTKDTPQRVEELAKGIKGYLDDFKKVYNQAGFFSKKELDDYFPREFNWQKINDEPEVFKKVIAGIYKNLKYNNPEKAAESFLDGIRTGGESVFNRKILSEIFTGSRKVSGVDKSGNKFIYTPISEHITQNRTLQGPYKIVEEVLEKNNYLINDAGSILNNLVNKSMKSIAFSRQFGENGQLLRPFFEQIKNKYESLGNKATYDQKKTWATKEAGVLADTVDAYFDRYGKQVDGAWRSSAAVLSTLSNLNMLGRVTISSLGDFVQPFQNTFEWTSFFKALPIVGQRGTRTAFTIKGEKGIADELGLAIGNEIEQGLMRPLGMESGNIINNSSWVGKDITRKTNALAFKFLGLEWLTGMARRFAYNVGAADAYGLSKTLNKMVSNGVSLDSNKALKVIRDLSKYDIKPQTALDMAKTKSIVEAIKKTTFKKALNKAGITTANRDALLPQTSNRLLFTQSQNPWVRLMGQFMSWAMAKSSQTNKILARIENGNTKTLIKMLATIPIYSGISSLRELAKEGKITTDFDSNNSEWFAKGWALSGNQGWLADLAINKIAGPGSREPLYQFAPVFQMVKGLSDVATSTVKGDWEKVLLTLDKRIAPVPEWRAWFMKLFPDTSGKSIVPLGKKISPLKLATGGIATLGRALLTEELTKNDNQEIDLVTEKKETQLVANKRVEEELKKETPNAYPFMIGASPVTHLRKYLKTKELKDKPIDTQMDKLIAPKEKPISMQVDKLIEPKEKPTNMQVDKLTEYKEQPTTLKTVDITKVSALESFKKEWLFDTAKKVYSINKNNIIPNDIILAINSEETGWGTSGFLKKGSNNLFNIQSFDKNVPHIKAQDSKNMIKKYDNEEDSIKDFLNMVQNSKKYSRVRETIQDFNKGKASKNDIVDAIAATGYAENKKWPSNVKDILNRRIEGKNKNELLNLYNSLYDTKK